MSMHNNMLCHLKCVINVLLLKSVLVTSRNPWSNNPCNICPWSKSPQILALGFKIHAYLALGLKVYAYVALDCS
jgi:hypothetical protein